MEIFIEYDKLSHVIRSNFHLLPVLNRFGISLGIKDKSIAEVCTDRGIQTDFFLAIINTFHNEDYFPETELMKFSPVLIIGYLRKTHQHYVDYTLPKIEKLLSNLIASCPDNCSDLKMIDSFYRTYKNELVLHIKDEEENVFPNIIRLVNKEEGSKPDFSILSFEQEHGNVDEKLNDLKNLIIKYLEPRYNNNDCNEFLIALSDFENDIKDHARIEDKVLLPKVKEIEMGTRNA
ncbi:MAG: hemerythrin domain-containing protein [Bacteroidales bacterium]|nr:hemerythrin domain-containing protein [Bacteroidales bacterium]MCF8457586.1 hemerythrin domain-containing protein [Bacteroidales bacterium]